MRLSRNLSLAILLIGSLALTPIAALAKGKPDKGGDGDAGFSKTVSIVVCTDWKAPPSGSGTGFFCS